MVKPTRVHSSKQGRVEPVFLALDQADITKYIGHSSKLRVSKGKHMQVTGDGCQVSGKPDGCTGDCACRGMEG